MSCDIRINPADVNCDGNKVKPADEEQPVQLTEQEEANKLGVTFQKFQSMKAYAAQLHQSDKRMKTATIRRKVCEKFKVKLV